MKVVVEEAGVCRKKLVIEVPAEQVQQRYEEALGEFVKAAKLPGFRPGKAPRALVNTRFAKEIAKEVREHLLPVSYRQALQEQKLEPVNILDLEEEAVVVGRPLTFRILVDVPPTFPLPTYRGLALQGQPVEVKDPQVEEVLKDIRERAARFEEIKDRPVRRGDLVQIDYTGLCDGQPIAQLAPKAAGLGQGEKFWVQADEHEFLPGFAAGLEGAAIGEQRSVPVSFPADFHEPAVAGKQALYTATVLAVREKQVPALDAALLAKLKVESEEKLRENVRKDLLSYQQDQEQERLKNEIVKQLLAAVTFDVPASEVQRETESTVYDIVRNSQYRGLSREQIEAQRGEIFEAAAKNAADKVKIRYLLKGIAEAEKITATAEEVDARIAALAARQGVSPRQARAELQKQDSLETLEQEVVLRKTVDFLLSVATVKT